MTTVVTLTLPGTSGVPDDLLTALNAVVRGSYSPSMAQWGDWWTIGIEVVPDEAGVGG